MTERFRFVIIGMKLITSDKAALQHFQKVDTSLIVAFLRQ